MFFFFHVFISNNKTLFILDYFCLYNSDFRDSQNSNRRQRKYQCCHCVYSTSKLADIRKHVLVHTGEKPYECNLCHRRFAQKTNLTRHIQTACKGSIL